MNTQYLAVCEIAEILSLSTKAANKLITDGHLPAFRFGSDIRVKAEDLEQFIEKSRIKGNLMNELINQAIMAASTYDGAVDAVVEVLAAHGTNLSKRDLESRAIKLVVEKRSELYRMEMEKLEQHRLQRMGY
jgi:excisionase family DNA binding protein